VTDLVERLLLPCPFCGHEAELLKLPETRPFVECRGRRAFDTSGFACAARTGYYSTEAEAIAAWNTRAYEAEITQLREDAREVAERLSIEAQVAAPTLSECSLRGKMGDCATTLFRTITQLQRELGNQPRVRMCLPGEE
jgi:hypothetical protein